MFAVDRWHVVYPPNRRCGKPNPEHAPLRARPGERSGAPRVWARWVAPKIPTATAAASRFASARKSRSAADATPLTPRGASLRRELALRVADAAVHVGGARVALLAERRIDDSVPAEVGVHASSGAAAHSVSGSVALGAEIALLGAIDDHIAAERAQLTGRGATTVSRVAIAGAGETNTRTTRRWSAAVAVITLFTGRDFAVTAGRDTF